MDRAIDLARSVEGSTSPNPPVGAVLVKGTTVVGEGSTQPPGGPHAEIVALRAAGEHARGAILYVTLEPCSHWGRTPPCADALIRAGVASVHASVLDPNPAVHGAGIRRLQEHGIEVVVGERSIEAWELILAHAHYTLSGRPFVTLFQSGPEGVLDRLVRTADVLLDDVPDSQAAPTGNVALESEPEATHTIRVAGQPVRVTDLRNRPHTSAAHVRSLPGEVSTWETMLAGLAGHEIAAALIPAPGSCAESMLGHGLVDRIVASDEHELPRGFTVPSGGYRNRSHLIAYRDDEQFPAPT